MAASRLILVVLVMVILQYPVHAVEPSKCNLSDLTAWLRFHGSLLGFEVYPFKVGDYNSEVLGNWPDKPATARNMTLDYSNDTLAFVFIYEGLPGVYGPEANPEKDHAIAFTRIQLSDYMFLQCPEYERSHFISPNDMHVLYSQLPKIHVQLAGNTSHGAYYYQESDVIHPPPEWEGKNIFGASWNWDYKEKTYFGGVLILEVLKVPTIQYPTIQLLTQAEIIAFLSDMNHINPLQCDGEAPCN